LTSPASMTTLHVTSSGMDRCILTGVLYTMAVA
jgi:hypothetical protein